MSLKDRLIAWLGATVIYWIMRSCRWRSSDSIERLKEILTGPRAIYSFWHGNQLALLWLYYWLAQGRDPQAKLRNVLILSSKHRDGRLIAQVAGYFKIDNVAGSSSKGSVPAVLKLIDQLKTDHHVALTPDGPKGPIYQVKDGVIGLAQQTGALIYPVSYYAVWSWKFKSWDKMTLPKPFTKIYWKIGAPLQVLESDDFEAKREELRVAMNRLDLELREEARAKR